MEALETAEEEPHADHFTVLPPRDGDAGDTESILEDVPDDLENEYGFEAAGEFEVDYGSDEESESGDVDPNCESSRKRVHGQDIARRRKRASFDVSLDDSCLQTYLEEEFPYLPTQSPFRIWSESSHIPSRSKPTCMHTVTAIFLLFRLAAKIFHPSLASFFCRAIIIFPKKTIIDRTVKPSASQLFQRQRAGQVFATSSDTFTLGTTTTWSKATKLRRLLQFTPVLTPPLPNLDCSAKICRLMNRWCHTLGATDVHSWRAHPLRVHALEPLRFGRLSVAPASLQRQRGNIKQRAPPGTRVVTHVHMVEVVRENSDVAKHHFFFDNFFTSHKLLSDLASEKVKATGTVRENRTGGANRDLTSTKEMKKSTCGTFDFCCDGTVFMYKWYDNSVITVASNCQNPLSSA